MKKRALLGLLCLMLAVLTACGTEKSNNNPASNEAVTIVDHIGREVTIEKEPETIVSGYYISTSLLIALEQEDKVIGIENDGDKRPVYGLSAPEFLELPGMGTVKEFDLETCAAMNPDLVILPFKLNGMAESLEQLGIPVVFVKPESQELLAETIEMIGKVTNSEEKAKKLQVFIDKKIKELEEAVKNADTPKVYLGGNSSLLSTAGPEMYQHSMIVNAKGRNVAEALTDTYWAEVSYEQILTWNPEYIILAADAKYTVKDVLADVNLQGCTAVKEGHVYKLPREIECWDSPVPGSVLGNLWLASILHPEAYSVTAYEESVTEFYETFYGFTP